MAGFTSSSADNFSSDLTAYGRMIKFDMLVTFEPSPDILFVFRLVGQTPWSL